MKKERQVTDVQYFTPRRGHTVKMTETWQNGKRCLTFTKFHIL